MSLWSDLYGEEKKPDSPKENYIKNEDFSCISDINEKRLLIPYFYCKAAARYDSAECSGLSFSDLVMECRGAYRTYQEFYLGLLNASSPTAELIEMFPAVPEIESREKRKKFIDAFIKGNISFCNSITDIKSKNWCEIMIKLDADLVSSNDKKDIIFYLRAIKLNNVAECKKIKDKALNIACQAFIKKDDKICQQDEGFKRLRNKCSR